MGLGGGRGDGRAALPSFVPARFAPGARGIAQFMPGTARAYGLRNPFDAASAIRRAGASHARPASPLRVRHRIGMRPNGRLGKPMRPDVARAFDRMAAAARRQGVNLIVTSGYRSDAEQARLYARNPNPRWVAPPGRSLHRLGTELDLGPSSAYGWLRRNARRFHFIQRYSWEAWH